MITPRALLTMGQDTKKIAGLLPGLGQRRLFFSFGDVIPDLTGFDVSYWSAGIWAARLQRVGLAQQVCSPGAAWLAKIDPELAGRTVQNGLLGDLCARLGPDERVWVKPAEAKIPAFPAGLYSPAEVTALLGSEKINAAVELQWADAVLTLDFEHRFFVADGEIVTGSPYRVGEVLGYWPGISWKRHAEAERFARHAVRLLAADDMLPPHFTLDVGLNTVTDTWLIIEGNRSWSSGVYGCEPAPTLAAIDAATHYTGERWAWRPDAEVALRAAEMPRLEVLPLDATTIGFVEYQG